MLIVLAKAKLGGGVSDAARAANPPSIVRETNPP